MQKEEKPPMNLPYRIHEVPSSAGWLVQRKKTVVSNRFRSEIYETLAYCKTLQEATDYLFAWKEINS